MERRTKSQMFSQVFEVDIGQDLSIKITQLTFFPTRLTLLFEHKTKSRNYVSKQFLNKFCICSPPFAENLLVIVLEKL